LFLGILNYFLAASKIKYRKLLIAAPWCTNENVVCTPWYIFEAMQVYAILFCIFYTRCKFNLNIHKNKKIIKITPGVKSLRNETKTMAQLILCIMV